MYRVGEVEMLCGSVRDLQHLAIRAHLQKSVFQTGRISGEIDGRGVGQILPLS
jgi:hypothetical protein